MDTKSLKSTPNDTNAVESHNQFSKGTKPDILKIALMSTYKVDMAAALEHFCVSETLESASSQYSSLPQPTRVVVHLSENYKGHRLFTDRYYTSIPLAQNIHDRRTSFTGTCVKNRVGLPSRVCDKSFHLKNYEVQAYPCDNQNLLIVGWHAAKKNKPVLMISSESSANPTQVRSVATSQESAKPLIVHEYNLSMNRVDKANQYTTYYSYIRKSKKLWRKQFIWLFEVAVVNSYIPYEITTPHPKTHLEYRRDALASHHIMAAPPRVLGRPRRAPLLPATGDATRLNKQPHFLEKRDPPRLRCLQRSPGWEKTQE